MVLLLAAALAQGCAPTPPVGLRSSFGGGVSQEPPEAAAFLAAYRQGDESTAEQVASPLYLKEWTRRKVPFDHRLGWVPAVRAASTSANWLDVSYANGVVQDDQGHLLYVGRSTQAGQRTTQSVWRLDTDASGRVIWAEMVWLFSESTGPLTTVSDPTAQDPARIPPVFARLHPQAVYGVRAASGWEGYYAVRYLVADQPIMNFFAVDEYGELRVGAWTYNPT